ncbi:enoyl-CoA hydratase/isomerase family protein [Leucobacter weissii]|uniref:enoyl-CoA hydratase n=1 Tax=Leucobacter weissii TaxID=1983706 RepID=A0A939MHU6_9MICO|nr:enoyl-CoA hydratase-related protein [Leucobacter weissii]MBO1900871.1 enoyl-CoA hydratase/isomerase family protein [Leucobacter weissii]
MTAAAQLADLELDSLRLEVAEGLLTVSVHRPEVLNALSPLVIAELREVFSLLRGRIGRSGDGAADDAPDWSIRGVILTGSGERSFVAGADISVMRDQSRDEAAAYAADAQELTAWIETLPVPVVAAVNGFALGGGCELAMACDYILASESASFGQPEVALGLIPGFGGCVRLQQYVGIAAARELILTGRRIDAQEARELGLALRVLPDAAALLDAARESLRASAAQSPTAVAAAKRTVRAAQALPTDRGLEIERQAFADRFGTPDMLEGTAAFVEKRRPSFPGA